VQNTVAVKPRLDETLAETLAKAKSPMLQRLKDKAEGSWSPQEVRAARRELWEMRNDSNKTGIDALRRDLDDAMETWAGPKSTTGKITPERAQYNAMKAVDKKFRETIVAARENYKIKGTATNPTFPSTETVINKLTAKAGDISARRFARDVPGGKEKLRAVVAALSKDDQKFFTSRAAEEVMDKTELEHIRALIAVLGGK
jgi:hypothetical protein